MSNAQFKSHYSSGNAQFVANYQAAGTPIVINCAPATVQITTVTAQIVFTQFGGDAQFIAHYSGSNAQFIPNYQQSGGGPVDITVICDIENGGMSQSSVTIQNPSSSTPTIYVDRRSGATSGTGGLWRHATFAVENAQGKTPLFRINRATKDGASVVHSLWRPVMTTDFVTWTQSNPVTFNGGTSGTFDFSFPDPLPSGRVYIASNLYGTQADAAEFANTLLTTYASVASPTLSANASGVYNTTPAENDDIGRAVGSNPQYAIKLAWPGPTTDGLRKRKLVVFAGIHAAGEQQSWIPFEQSVLWMLNSNSAEAIAFRANWDVYLYFLLNPNGVRQGNSRVTPRNTTDPNRDWASRTLNEIAATYNAVIADTSGAADALFSWHGDTYHTDEFMGWVWTPDASAGTRSAAMQAMIDEGTVIFGAAPDIATSSSNNSDVWFGRSVLGAQVAFDNENSATRETTLLFYDGVGAKWMRTLQAVDADGLFVQPDPGIINCAPATITVTGQLAQVIMSSGGSNTINTTPAAITVQGVTATIISGGSIPEPPPVNTNYPSWLNDPSAIRCILVEVQAKSGSSEVNRFLSSRPFKSASTDIPANTVYNPIVIGSSVRTVERLEITSNAASISFGDIEMDNHDGSIDSWLSDIWSNRAIRVYLGDVRWTRAEFQPVFDGVVEDIGSRSRTTLNLKLRDKLQRLNTPVTEVTLGGTTNNKNQLLPLLFGECHNITPLLTNPATLEYQVHNGIVERIVEIRDNGVPVSGVATLSTGKFTLNASPAGKITCTAQGDKPSGTWNNTAKKIIERLVTAYGEPNTRFTTGDLDTTSLNTFDAANPQTLGIYLSNRENVLSICNKIASTVGSRLVMTRDGKLKLVKIELPASGTPFIITDADVITGSLYISRKLEVKAGVKLAYCKNWSVQENLDTRIPSSHKVLHSREWLVTVARDNTVKSDYRIDGEPEQEETFFLTEAHASAEAVRLLNLFKTIRYIVTFKATAKLFQLQLGQAVTLTYPRFGLDAGKSGMVVGLSPDWDRGLIDVEVFV